MKTITSILAAAALFASVGAAQANFAEDFWNKQQLFGENAILDTDVFKGN